MNGIKSFPFGKGSISFVSLISRFSRFAICSEISSFSFLEFPETFKLFSSCPSSFHLPEASRLPFAGFLCYEIFMVLALFGHCPLFSEHLLFYHLLSCLSATFLFFSVFLSSSSWPLSSDSLSILPNHSLSVNTFFETFLSFFLSPCFHI